MMQLDCVFVSLSVNEHDDGDMIMTMMMILPPVIRPYSLTEILSK